MKGWVYIISNKAMPDVIKVGYTNKDPTGRAAELGTGSPYKYRVEYEMLVDNALQIEQKAHRILSNFNVGKEWFSCEIPIALKAIKEACGDGVIYFERLSDPTKAEPVVDTDVEPAAPVIQQPTVISHDYTKGLIKGIKKAGSLLSSVFNTTHEILSQRKQRKNVEAQLRQRSQSVVVNYTLSSGINGIRPSQRKVGFFLFIGVLFMPYIFAWFLLRDGHSKTAKIISFSWMALVIVALSGR